jgi:parallel beta-helix repeat protein
MLSFLLLSTLSLLSITKPVHAYTANSIIYIRSTGNVDPSTAPITRTGDLYTLTEDISSSFTSAIIIQKNNIVLDGAGFALHGSAISKSNGINATGTNNVTITNFAIDSFDYGIFLSTSINSLIKGNTITGHTGAGIYLYYSSFNNVSRNKLTSNFAGLRLDTANYNSISCNNVTSNSYGIYFIDSQGNQIFHNNFITNALNAYGTWDLGPPIPGNTWDNGYPSGGNYWSDYNGIDANQDGIGDTPLTIDANNIDNYPLMQPYGTYGLTIEVNLLLGGTTNPSPGTYQYETGTEIEVTATPSLGFMFAYWRLDSETISDNSINVLLNHNVTLEAFFTPKEAVPVVPFGVIGTLLALIFTLIGFAWFKRTPLTRK